MKLTSLLLIVGGIFFITACGHTTRFPVSAYAPAADIKAKTKMDKNNNHVVTITAKNLASADRVDPSSSGSAYVIWMKTNNNEVKNLGQLKNENAQTASLTTVTPFKPKEFFITLEQSADVSSPSGTEISRAEIIDQYGDSNSMPDNDSNYDNDGNSGTRNSNTFGSPSDTTRMK